ncbi:MAG: glycosyltransferase family 61 protein [Cytophagales bacterium]|nr:glycosyltransferase family 61 protein [Cytophagales bacterium]
MLHSLFGVGPLKVDFFNNVYPQAPSSPVDVPEILSYVLKNEQGSQMKYQLPVTLGNVPLNIRKIKKSYRYAHEGVFRAPQRSLYSIHKGVILGETGIIYDTAKRVAIDESALEWSSVLTKNRFFTAWRLSKPAYLQGIALSIASIGSDGGFYHFLHEAIPKLYFAKDFLPHLNYILISGEPLAWKLKWLNALPFTLPQIIWLKRDSHLQFDQIIFTNHVVTDHQPSPWSANILRDLYALPSLKNTIPHRIIWASRGSVKLRDFKWENEFLSKYSFIENVDFSSLTVYDTMRICAEAKLIISPHGAALANLVFCSAGTKVLEIFPNTVWLPLYSRLSNSASLHHYIIHLDFENDNARYGLSYFIDIFDKFIANEQART